MIKEKKKLTSEELKNIISRDTISTFKFYILDTKAADQIDLWLDELIQDNTEKVIKLLILSEGCTAEGASKICKKIQSIPNPIVGIVVRNEDYHLWDLGIASILSACDASVLINNYYHKNSKKNSLFQLSLYHELDDLFVYLIIIYKQLNTLSLYDNHLQDSSSFEVSNKHM